MAIPLLVFFVLIIRQMPYLRLLGFLMKDTLTKAKNSLDKVDIHSPLAKLVRVKIAGKVVSR